MPAPQQPARVQLPDPDELIHLFSAASWQNGQRYARTGAVEWSEIMVDPDSPDADFRLCGEVQGTDLSPYETDIHLWRQGRGRWKLVGDCTCPVGVNCKHAATILCKFSCMCWRAKCSRHATA